MGVTRDGSDECKCGSNMGCRCYPEAVNNIVDENLKKAIRKEVIYELQTFLKEFE